MAKKQVKEAGIYDMSPRMGGQVPPKGMPPGGQHMMPKTHAELMLEKKRGKKGKKTPQEMAMERKRGVAKGTD